jgi:aryl-alcohol dehydrogenase-like predicted oxidoreductase
MRGRVLGDREVSMIGLGAMPMSTRADRDELSATRTIHAALDAGVTLIDTADAYCWDEHDVGHNERIIAESLRRWNGDHDTVLVATKGGSTRLGGGWQVDGTPAHLREACEASLVALDVDQIGLYQFHRPDPSVPYAESVGALGELQREGKIRLIGISNANTAQIAEAAAEVPLVSVQNELSPDFRSSLHEVRYCADHGLAFLAWGALGGRERATDLGRRHPAFATVAAQLGVTPQQLALAWALAQGPTVIPIPGASHPESILSSVAAADIALTMDEIAALEPPGRDQRP